MRHDYRLRVSGGRLKAAGVVLAAVLFIQTAVAGAAGVFNVSEFGAVGDDKETDTKAINAAIEKCAASGGGRVVIGPGKFLTGTLHLKSHVTLYLEAGSRLVGTAELDEYQAAKPPSYMPEAKWGKWHRAMILAEGVENIAIAGDGVIDGNKVFDPTGEEKMRGPHTFIFVGCRNVSVRDVSFVDSANYAIFFMVSDHVDIHNVDFRGGWDGVHWRGGEGHPCRDVSIVGCRFFTGDDAIAGRYWENTLISDCIINSSCNGIRLIGPAEHLIIHGCLFYGPGLEPHRSSGRNNMLAAINLQPGAWDATKGRLDDVLISDITMHNVCAPFHISLKPGNSAGKITVDRVSATGVYRAAASVESWAETPFEDVTFRDVTFEYTGGGTKEQSRMEVKSPGVDPRALPAWGFYGRNVKRLVLNNVRLRRGKADARAVLIGKDIEELTVDDFDYPKSEEPSKDVVLDNVGQVRGDKQLQD